MSLHVSTTLNINQRDNTNPTAFGPDERSAPTAGARSLSLRQNIAPVKIISTHLFTLKYDLMPRHNSGLSTGAKVGIAVGAGIGGMLLLFLLVLLISRARRRGHKRKVAEASSAFVSSGVVSPRTAGSTYPASNYSRAQTAISDRSGGAWTSPDRARSPISQPSVELPSQPSSAMAPQPPTPPLPALPVVKSIAPQELSAAPVSPTEMVPPVALASTEARAATPSAEFETHQFFSPTGGKFR